jgi:hypothetical protein
VKKHEFDRDFALLQDRTSDVRACCGRIVDSWRYDLTTRKVGEAYENDDGVYTTDLDLACFLSLLISKDHRHGQVLGLTSNADVWSFGVLFNDANVMTADSVGRPRIFTLQDIDGTWYEGWRELELLPATEEEKRLFENTSHVTFKHFIHPNRWTSFYGRAYLLAKVAELRLQDQVRFLKAEVKRIKAILGVVPEPWAKSSKVGEERPEEVWAFNACIDGVKFDNEYDPFDGTGAGLDAAQDLLHRCDELLRTLRFHIRATEFSFWSQVVVPKLPGDGAVLQWLRGGGTELEAPHWCKTAWQTGVKAKDDFTPSPKAKTHWAVLEREGVPRLAWRAYRKTEQVAV